MTACVMTAYRCLILEHGPQNDENEIDETKPMCCDNAWRDNKTLENDETKPTPKVRRPKFDETKPPPDALSWPYQWFRMHRELRDQ